MSHDALNPEQFVGYHVALARYRSSIEEHGLRPSSPYAGPRGVYLHHNLEGAQRWRSREPDDPQDIYEVTLKSGRQLRPDIALRDASVYPRQIPSKRVKRVVEE